MLDRANVICLMNGKDIVAWFVLYCNDKIFYSAYCAGLYVLEQYRKHGFSKVLLAEAIEKSKKAGMKRLNLYCKSDNLVAFALYQSFGFKILKKSRLLKYGNDYYYLLSKNLDWVLGRMLFKYMAVINCFVLITDYSLCVRSKLL